MNRDVQFKILRSDNKLNKEIEKVHEMLIPLMDTTCPEVEQIREILQRMMLIIRSMNIRDDELKADIPSRWEL